MGALRKHRGVCLTGSAVAVAALLALAAPLRAAPEGPGGLLADFATCTGRMSALVEHRWLMARDPAQAEAEHAAMGDVLDAVLTPDTAIRAMEWRVTAKAAMRALLQRADLQNDTAARDRAAVLIGQCRRLILAPGA